MALSALDYLDRLSRAAGSRPLADSGRDAARAGIESGYARWARALFPFQTRHAYAERHHELWAWLWAIRPGLRPPPFVGIWPRGGGKSATAEVGSAALGGRGTRRYILYVSATQPQADKHVQAIGTLLESPAIERYYPEIANPAVNKFGSSKGWRRDQLRTRAGFSVEGVGLDVASRGFKIDDARPDMIILDDIDALHDSAAAVRKKVETITESILPTGSTDCAILFVQNRVHDGSIAAQFIDGNNSFLMDHILSGPFPAVDGLVLEPREIEGGNGRRRYHIVGGTATWEGQPLEVCEAQANDWGPDAFKAEAQHERRERPGGLFSHLEYIRIARAQLPDLVRSVVWCDPAVSNTDDSDCYAVSGAGIDGDGLIYRLHNWEGKTSPEDCLRRALLVAIAIGALHVGVETDQGGDAWESVYWRAAEAITREFALAGTPLPYMPRFRAAKAGSYGSKVQRASQMLLDYERGEIRHVLGTHEAVEAALFRFPKVKPFDLTDASFWSWADLRGMIPDDDEGPGLLLSGGAPGWFGLGSGDASAYTDLDGDEAGYP